MAELAANSLGGARRCWLHGKLAVSKRYLLQVAARNLGLIMRKLFGIGTPRGLQKAAGLAALVYLVAYLLSIAVNAWIRLLTPPGRQDRVGAMRGPGLATDI